MKYKIPLYKAEIKKNEIKAVKNYLLTEEKNRGKEIKKLENKLAEIHGVKHVLAVSSGTLALFVLFQALEMTEGDQVYLPSYTWPSAANAANLLGAQLHFIDVNPSSFCLESEQLKIKPTSGKNFIISIHQFGNIWKLDELIQIAEENNAILIEDSAWALGLEHGLKGKAGIFSFHPRKLLSAGEGGAIYTDDDSLYQRCKIFRNHGLNKAGKLVVPSLNARMPEIQAVILNKQLQKIDQVLAAKKKTALAYRHNLENNNQIILPEKHNSKLWPTFNIILKQKRINPIIKYMQNKGIEVRPSSVTTHLEPFYRKKFPSLSLPVSEHLAANSLSLPMYKGITREETKLVCTNLQRAILL
ncbi:MAG: DegT/DnrJ/EryC1/StrS family aminotransferase [Myxococcota bacterium]